MSDELLAGIVGATGVVAGVLISQLLEFSRQRHAFAIRQKEKLIDKRIDAHESIIDLAESMAVVVMPDIALGNLPTETEIPHRAISFLYEKGQFDNWWAKIFYSCYRKHVWHEVRHISAFVPFMSFATSAVTVLSPTIRRESPNW